MARKNFAITTVASSGAPSPATSGTSITVTDGSKLYVGKAFAMPNPFDPLTQSAETITITNISTNTLTVTRNSDSRGAQSIADGWVIQQGLEASEADSFITTGFDPTKLRVFFIDPDATSNLCLKTGTNTALSNSQGLNIVTDAGDSSATFQFNNNRMGSILGAALWDSIIVGRIFIRRRPANAVTFNVYFGANGPGNTSADNTESIGIRSNGSTLLARNGSGSAETTTDIGASFTADSTENKFVEIVFTPGVNVKFYIDGTLVATHTTNLPSGAGANTTVSWTSVRVTTSSTASTTILGTISMLQLQP